MQCSNRHCLTVKTNRAGEKITVTPSSKELLFYPPEVEATITGGTFLHTHTHLRLKTQLGPKPVKVKQRRSLSAESCPGQLVDIAGRAGLFLAGKVSPELQDVEISITERGADAPLITVATNEMGAYRYES